MLRVLVLSRDLRFRSEVSDFVRTLSARMKSGVRISHFPIGKRRDTGFRPLKFLFRPFFDALRLRRVVRRGECDVVHLNPSFEMKSLIREGVLSFFMRSSKTPVLAFFHGRRLKVARRVLRFRPFRMLFKLAFGKVAALAVPAEALKEELVRAGFNAEKVHVFHTMFEGHAFQDDAFREKHLARRTGKTLLFLGLFIKEKGPYETVSAFASLKKGQPDLKLVMAGDGPEREGLVQSAEELGVAQDVGFPGDVQGRDRAALFLSCDIFVLPTALEGCPAALLEAMGAGCGVVTTPVDGIADVVEPGGNGIILHEVTTESVAKGISRLLRDPEALSAMQQANREIVFERHETNIVLNNMKRLYEGMVES